MKARKSLISKLIILLCICLLLPLSGCSGSKPFEMRILSMNTEMTLTAYGRGAQEGVESAASMINALNTRIDPDNELSAIYEINNANGEGTVVKGQILDMLRISKDIYEQTNGAYNPAVYPIIKAWGFIDCSYRVPTEEEISGLLKYTDFSQVKITDFPEVESNYFTMPSGMQISFAAIAKGYASQMAVTALKDAGIKSAIVSLGGNIQTLGKKPDGSNWRIAIQDPQDTGAFVGVLSIGEAAVITSGGYNRYFDGPDGKRYCHIVNPTTGMPVDNGILSVTIICDNGARADALSTALYVMGEKKALTYYRQEADFDMILVMDDNRVIVTNGLYSSFEEQGKTYNYEYVGLT